MWQCPFSLTFQSNCCTGFVWICNWLFFFICFKFSNVSFLFSLANDSTSITRWEWLTSIQSDGNNFTKCTVWPRAKECVFSLSKWIIDVNTFSREENRIVLRMFQHAQTHTHHVHLVQGRIWTMCDIITNITCLDWDLEFRSKLYHSSMSVFEVINEWSGCRNRNFCSYFDMHWQIFQNKITLQSKYLYNRSTDSFRIYFLMWQ